MIRFKDYLVDYLDEYNISNKDFARRIGITPKHFSGILSGERNLSRNVIANISLVTGISVDWIYRIEDNYNLNSKIKSELLTLELNEKEYLKPFNIGELIEKQWIDFKNVNEPLEVIKDLMQFLRISSIKDDTLDRQILYKSNNTKKELLLLWLEKCYKDTLTQEVEEYKKGNINKIVKYINESAKNNIFDPEKLKEVFNKNGIYLVIQEDLKGSKIRGAFKVHKNKPAIYITLKHKRVADIYFALLHELAHCKTDFNKAMSQSIVSLDDNLDVDIEQKADQKAYDWMINNETYELLTKEYKDNLGVINDVTNTHPKCFFVYRLAKDGLLKYNSKIYQENNILL